MISLASNPAVTSNKPVRSRLKGQGGTAALEGPLVILPLMAIGFAMLDYPLDIFIQNTTRNAEREGVRFAITQPAGAAGPDAAIKTVVENNSMGFLNNADLTTPTPKPTITITYYDKTTPAAASTRGFV